MSSSYHDAAGVVDADPEASIMKLAMSYKVTTPVHFPSLSTLTRRCVYYEMGRSETREREREREWGEVR